MKNELRRALPLHNRLFKRDTGYSVYSTNQRRPEGWQPRETMDEEDSLAGRGRRRACGTGNGDCRASWPWPGPADDPRPASAEARSEEHTSELQSLMRISYAV